MNQPPMRIFPPCAAAPGARTWNLKVSIFLVTLAGSLGACTPLPRGDVARITGEQHLADAGEFRVELLPSMRAIGLTFRAQIPEFRLVDGEIIKCYVTTPSSPGAHRAVELRDSRTVRYRQAGQEIMLTLEGTDRTISCHRPDSRAPFVFDLIFEVDEVDAGDDLNALVLTVPPAA